MISEIIKIILCGAACERIASIIVASAIFEPLRIYLGEKAYPDTPNYNRIAIWLHKLITCTECTGVWGSVILYLLADIKITDNILGNAIISIFSIAYLGQLFETYRRGKVNVLELEHKVVGTTDINIQTNQNETLTCESDNG